MTDYIKYAPQIADAFNVTKQHVFDVYVQTQITESSTWLYMSQIWGLITIIGALLCGFILFASSKGDKGDSFITGLVCGAIIFGIIGAIICIGWGSYTIQMAQPEYMNWIGYVSSMKFGLN